MYSTAARFIQGYMLIVWNVYTSVFDHIVDCIDFIQGMYTDVVALSMYMN